MNRFCAHGSVMLARDEHRGIGAVAARLLPDAVTRTAAIRCIQLRFELCGPALAILDILEFRRRNLRESHHGSKNIRIVASSPAQDDRIDLHVVDGELLQVFTLDGSPSCSRVQYRIRGCARQ
jgi:hypothetical protein